MNSADINIDTWLDRVRRMTEYRVEAADFLHRASSILPTADADLELVCRLWAIADEHDTYICEALQKFDRTVFGTPGELEITRGAEPVVTPGGNDSLLYLCTWTIARPETQSASVVLTADQLSARLEFEVRDSTGIRQAVGFPIGEDESLLEALTSSFFTLYGEYSQFQDSLEEAKGQRQKEETSTWYNQPANPSET